MKMTYSRRELYALGEPIGNSSTEHKITGGYLCGGGGGGGDVFSDAVDAIGDAASSVGDAVSGAVEGVGDFVDQYGQYVAAAALAVATDGASLAVDAAAEGAAAAVAEGVAADTAIEAGTTAAIDAGAEAATAAGTTAATEGVADAGASALTEGAIDAGATGLETAATTGAETLGDTAANTTFDNALNTAENAANNANPLQNIADAYKELDPVAKGALKGVGKNLLTSTISGKDINPLGVATSALTGGIGSGVSDAVGGGFGGALAGTAASTAAGMGIKEALGGSSPVARMSGQTPSAQPTVKPASNSITTPSQTSTLAALNAGDNSSGGTSFAGTAPLGLNGGTQFNPLRPQDSVSGAGMFDKSGLPVAPKPQVFNTASSNDNASLMHTLNQLNPKLIGQIYKRGGIVKRFANGGHVPEFKTGSGRGIHKHYVKGEGDGQSDDIPAMLADGEYVFDADTVAQLGNGSSDAGAKLLDHFREALREHKRSASSDKIPPAASPLSYMKEALKRHGAKQKKG